MLASPPPQNYSAGGGGGGGGGGGERGAGPPVPLFLRLCSLPIIYFSSDTVCLATVYPEREREKES